MICDFSDTIENIKPQAETDKYYIHILLLRYPDRFSKVFCGITGSEYSHVTIGVNDSSGIFYSYTGKGFRKELPIKHPTFKEQEVPCRLYQLEVTKEIHEYAKTILEDHAAQAHNFKYNFFGVVLCLLRIVFPIKNRYFCSQFVSEILEKIKAVQLTKHTSLYLPDDFMKMQGLDLHFSGCLSRLVKQVESVKVSVV